MKLTAQSMRHPAVRIGGSVLILGVLLAFVPLRKLGVTLRSIPPTLWLSLVFGYLATHVIGVIKWRLTLRLSQARLTFAEATRCYFAGLFGTVFLPSIVGGDVIRMGLAFRIERNKAAVLLGSLVDRLLDIVSLVAVAGIGVLLLPGALDARSRRIFAVLAVVFILSAAGFLCILAIIPWQRLPFKVRRLFVKLRRAWRSIASRPLYVLVPFTLGVILQTSFVALSASIAAAWGLHVSFYIWLLVWPLAKLLALVPITLGGMGIREAGLAALLAPFGAPAALAVATGLSWESILIAGGLLAGLVSFLISGTGFASFLRALGKVRPLRQDLSLPPNEMSSMDAEG
jgi:glycosyltransferase 2 family protein